MPPRHIHNLFDLLLGLARYYGEFDWVHRMLDQPWQKYFGKRHRRILHDEKAVQTIAQMFGPRAGMVAYYHILIDKLFSELQKSGKKKKRKKK